VILHKSDDSPLALVDSASQWRRQCPPRAAPGNCFYDVARTQSADPTLSAGTTSGQRPFESGRGPAVCASKTLMPAGRPLPYAHKLTRRTNTARKPSVHAILVTLPLSSCRPYRRPRSRSAPSTCSIRRSQMRGAGFTRIGDEPGVVEHRADSRASSPPAASSLGSGHVELSLGRLRPGPPGWLLAPNPAPYSRRGSTCVESDVFTAICGSDSDLLRIRHTRRASRRPSVERAATSRCGNPPGSLRKGHHPFPTGGHSSLKSVDVNR